MSTDVSDRTEEGLQPAGSSVLRKLFLPLGLILAVAAVGVAIAVWFRVQRGLNTAALSLRSHQYAEARAAAERYLWLYPDDPQARLYAAKGYALDDDLPAESAARYAVAHLEKIPDTAQNAAEARTLEGRLTFLILLQPTRAEKLFKRALEVDPDQFDSNYLLWKLYDMTERYFESESFFRATYRLVPEEQKSFRLREWYLSQFNPLSACGELDEMMGFRQATEPASETVAYRRLTAFADNEPDSPIIAAAVAQAYLRNRQRDLALDTLEKVPDSDSVTEPFYLATLTEVLLELGQPERAKKIYAKWPESSGGYRYWRISGMIAQLADADFARAADFFKRALADWPGPSDWLTMHRRFRCLALLGDKEEAESVRKRSEVVEALMELDVHQKRWDALTNLNDPKRLAEIAEFYGTLDRPWEQQQWEAEISRLTRN